MTQLTTFEVGGHVAIDDEIRARSPEEAGRKWQKKCPGARLEYIGDHDVVGTCECGRILCDGDKYVTGEDVTLCWECAQNEIVARVNTMERRA